MKKNAKIFVAGHQGMVGSAIVRKLKILGYKNLLLRTSEELDLINQNNTELFFQYEKPEYVVLAAAKVGGIMANNKYRAEFIYNNLMIQNNVIHSAWKYGVKKLLFLGSSCIYPRHAPQPMKEEHLLTGRLEPTNEPYAIAKISGIKMCENYYRQYGCNFISVMPTNLNGANPSFDLEKSHVIPALIRKMHLGKCIENNDWNSIRQDLKKRPIKGISYNLTEKEILKAFKNYGLMLIDSKPNKNYDKAKQVVISLWGTGSVYREFMDVDDMADACMFILELINASRLYDELNQTHINIGTGKDLKISELADIVRSTVGYRGEIFWDVTKPDGMEKKQLDVSMLNSLGWRPSIDLNASIKNVYKQYIETLFDIA